VGAARAGVRASDGAPGRLAMTGPGFGPMLQATPRSLFVGPTALGTARSGRIVITNVGLDPQRTAPLTISNISVISDDPAWTVETATPIDVGPPGGQATVALSFRPTRAGLSQAVLALASNDR